MRPAMNTAIFIWNRKRNQISLSARVCLLFLNFFFFFSLSAFSQVFQRGVNLDEFGRLVRSANARESSANGLTYSNIAGTPFLLSEFTKGTVMMPDSSVYQDVLLRYDIYADRMEFSDQNGQIREILEPGKYGRFVIKDQAFRYVSYTEANKTSQSFMEILADGKITLYKKIRVQFQEATEAGGYKDAEPPKFVQLSPDLYLSVNGNPAERIKNQKQTLSVLAGENPAIDAFVKKEKLNLNKEEELIQAVQFCNR